MRIGVLCIAAVILLFWLGVKAESLLVNKCANTKIMITTKNPKGKTVTFPITVKGCAEIAR